MSTVTETVREINVVCPTCGYCRLRSEVRRERECPSCAAEARLAEAVAALRAEDDYEALNAAADAIRSLLIDAPVWRNMSPWGDRLVAVRMVRDPRRPERPTRDGDDD